MFLRGRDCGWCFNFNWSDASDSGAYNSIRSSFCILGCLREVLAAWLLLAFFSAILSRAFYILASISIILYSPIRACSFFFFSLSYLRRSVWLILFEELGFGGIYCLASSRELSALTRSVAFLVGYYCLLDDKGRSLKLCISSA